ncbi:hypothetical protein AB0I82_04075 [Streptomyces sp. NPDC050315]|uniref:hypothetical protein n=1 Tax=Streptomyces sp. NPDC050315 TaxID=3155039 RepID=UPI003423C5C7
MAVLTTSRTVDGRFRPRCGDLVAHARATGLIYLQHIVAVHANAVGDRLVPHRHTHLHRPTGSDSAHLAVHSDLLIFVAPGPGASDD